MEQLQYIGWFLAISAGTILTAIVVNWLFRRFLKRSSLIMRNDPTNYVFLRHALTALIYVLGFGWAIYTLPDLRAIANSLLAGAGILAVAVGFASQHALANVISGVFIIIFKPFRVNDRLRLQSGLSGIVEDITLRHVVIRDFEHRRILIPNSVISDEVIVNSDFTGEKICRWVEPLITFDSDLLLARKIMQEEGEKHPLLIDWRSPEDIEAGAPLVRVRVIRLEDNGVRLRAYLWANNDGQGFELSCDFMEAIKLRFDREGIRLAMPHRVLVQQEKAGRKEEA
jgi:small-conductance mechanosensitive channel